VCVCVCVCVCVTGEFGDMSILVHIKRPPCLIQSPLLELRHIELCGGRITNAGVARLAALPNLTSINLSQVGHWVFLMLSPRAACEHVGGRVSSTYVFYSNTHEVDQLT